jgi:hypothetical protein
MVINSQYIRTIGRLSGYWIWKTRVPGLPGGRLNCQNMTWWNTGQIQKCGMRMPYLGMLIMSMRRRLHRVKLLGKGRRRMPHVKVTKIKMISF